MCGGFGTDVEAHPVRWNGVGGDDLGVGIRRKRIGAQRIGRQEQFRTAGLGLLEDGQGLCVHLRLDQAGADGAALRLNECVGHAAAHNQAVHAADEVFDDAEFGAHFGASDDGGQGLFGVGQDLVQRIDFTG